MSVSTAYFAVILIWSTTPLGIVWSSESINPTMAVLLRMLIALSLGAILNNETISTHLIGGAFCVLSGLFLYHFGEKIVPSR